MIFIRKIKTVLRSPSTLLIKPLMLFSKFFNDRTYLKILFPLKVGYKLNLDNPKTFNEKLQWLKLYYRRPELTSMVDKYESKKYVSKLIGNDYVITNLGVWNNFEDIDFESLPNQFVLKTTHDQGGVVVCKDKKTFDIESARKKLNKHLESQHFYLSREWPYKNIQPRILAEEYMEEEDGRDLKDFKFFCFDGIPKLLFIATERQSGRVRFDYFDMDFNHLNLVQAYDQSKTKIEKPEGFDQMVELAKKLSANLPHVRVDLYEIRGNIYFGELTFFHHGGLVPFSPEEWDYKLGSWIDLGKAVNN